MFRSVLAICIFMAPFSIPVNADNYSFTVDKIAVSTTTTSLQLDANIYKYPVSHMTYKNYLFNASADYLAVFHGLDEIDISACKKRPNYKGCRKITLGHKTNVYVSHESPDSPVGDSWIYSFYFKGHEVTCIYPSAKRPPVFSQIINSIAPSAPVRASNYSFILDNIAVSTNSTGIRVDNKIYKYPFEHITYKYYMFNGYSTGLTIFHNDDAVMIDKVSKRPNYKGWKRITVGHKTNVYVDIDRESVDSPTGDNYDYSFYFAGYEVTCNYPPGPPPSFFSQIINTIKEIK